MNKLLHNFHQIFFVVWSRIFSRYPLENSMTLTRLSRLLTRHSSVSPTYEKRLQQCSLFCRVRRRGLEPPRPYGHIHLKDAWLPVTTPAQVFVNSPFQTPARHGVAIVPNIFLIFNLFLLSEIQSLFSYIFPIRSVASDFAYLSSPKYW